MMTAVYGQTNISHKIDYKTVGGYDRKIGSLSYEGENIDVIEHVGRHKVFDGVTEEKYRTDKLICPCCGYTKNNTQYSSRKIIK